MPALATLAAVVFERSEDRSLPRRRSDLYDRFIELMLEERNEESCRLSLESSDQLYRGEGLQIAGGLWKNGEALATVLAPLCSKRESYPSPTRITLLQPWLECHRARADLTIGAGFAPRGKLFGI